MKIETQHLAYFSATNNTQNVIRSIGSQMDLPSIEYNLSKIRDANLILSESDLLIVGVPSFAGRVPQICLPTLNQFIGHNTPAIIFCTYGNRDFDDTLLEMRDVLSDKGFKIISAAAFVAQHSIFPKVGEGRPNQKDDAELVDFISHSLNVLKNIEDINDIGELPVKGNSPYKPLGNIPLKPTGNSKCDACGICVSLCPTKAIPHSNPKTTDKAKCISCAKCIAVCPQQSRAFRGLLYRFASWQFVKKHLQAQPNVFYYNGDERS